MELKGFNWRKWLVIGIIAAVVIAILVLHLVQPKITYAFAEVMSFLTFVAGGVAGWFIGKYFNKE